MNKIGLFRVMKLCKDYVKMGEEERKGVQEKRLRELVQFARENSPYYARLYQGLPDNFTLTDLPPVNKIELMNCFSEWITDSTITLQYVKQFMEDMDHVGRKMNGKYLIFTTSGSTGNPLVALCDTTANNVMGGISATRSFARKEDMSAFIRKGRKIIGVFATSGFYLSNSSVRSRLLAMPWKKKKLAVTSALLPINQIVEQLNTFQPTMLGGYPSNLELLIDEVKSDRLHISPVIIMTGGEYLSDSLRERLSQAFHCYVQTAYSCTEGGTIACECRERHFHVNEDWVLIEPVDEKNRPVPDGVRSDKVLLTNFFNYTQPYIRYELTDRVIMHHTPCACGNPSPWLELEGRTDDVASFWEGCQEIKVAPLALYAILKEVHELRRFQIVVKKENHVEMRIEPIEGIPREDAFHKAEQALVSFLRTQGIHEVTVTLSEDVPMQHQRSGKFKHIINDTGK
ncbi:MAG TPA: phenylacetate--CoA ligase family protein [Lachnospiraceae bacterium]|nr:phenylacetate--CoA ligase family protein [Lachnospiraceae bacterium]